jgi:hypothetical protein
MHRLSRTLGVRIEWSLAVVLQTMTACALTGVTARRIRAVVEHLCTVKESQAISMELHTTCAHLSESWRAFDPQ